MEAIELDYRVTDSRGGDNLNLTIYFLLFLPAVIALIQQKKNKDWVIQYFKLKHRKDDYIMREVATKFIDKECLIYLLNGQVNGIIREVIDNSLLIETPTDRQIVNLDFVIRIREYPKNKHGKKKSVVWN